MPIFELQAPDGAIYEVEAPDEMSAVGALGYQASAPRVFGDERDQFLQQARERTEARAGGQSIPRAPENAPEFVPTDQRGMAGSAAMGAADMATFGFGDEMASYPASMLSGVPRNQVLAEMRGNQKRASEDNPKSYLAGQIAGAIAGGGAMARSGLSLGANAIRSGYRLPGVAAGSAIDGAAIGAAQGAGAGENAEERLSGAGTGMITGLGLGAAAPFAVAGASNAVQRAISPFRMSPERQAAAAVLEREGIPLTAGQRTGSDAIRYAESELGGSAASRVMDAQAEAFTDAAMRRAGGRGLATPENMRAIRDRLGQGFDDISSRNAVRVDQGLVDDMNRARGEYRRVLPSEQRQIFDNLGDEIADRFRQGRGYMAGEEYQTIRSRLSRMAQSNRQRDPEFATAIRGLRDALDEGMARSVAPDDAATWTQLRREYGNMKTLERASGGGGEDAAMGAISPARLRMAASTGNRGGYARGEGDFAELARAGQATMTPLPNSGTAARQAVRNFGIPGASAGVGFALANVPGALAGAAVPYVAGRALMSRPVQRYLANQLASGEMSPQARALATAIMSGTTARLGAP